MSIIKDILAAIARMEKHGEKPDTLIMSPDIFDPRKPYHGKSWYQGHGTNRIRKQRRFRSRKRVEFMRRQLSVAKMFHALRSPLRDIGAEKYLKSA